MVRSSYIHTKNNLIPVAKGYKRISYRCWWTVSGIYGDYGNGKIMSFHQTKSYEIKICKRALQRFNIT